MSVSQLRDELDAMAKKGQGSLQIFGLLTDDEPLTKCTYHREQGESFVWLE